MVDSALKYQLIIYLHNHYSLLVLYTHPKERVKKSNKQTKPKQTNMDTKIKGYLFANDI